MRKKVLLVGSLIIIGLAFIYGYQGKGRPKDIALRVNNFVMTQEEFEEEFRESGMPDTTQTRQRFLEGLINRKLVLQEAERLGLDKEREFLKTIERFWEQSLFKIMIEAKSKEIAGRVSVTDKEIEDYYNDLLKKGRATKPLSESYSEMKWQILRNKQTQALNDWIEELRKNAKIELNEKFLKWEE